MDLLEALFSGSLAKKASSSSSSLVEEDKLPSPSEGTPIALNLLIIEDTCQNCGAVYYHPSGTKPKTVYRHNTTMKLFSIINGPYDLSSPPPRETTHTSLTVPFCQNCWRDS